MESFRENLRIFVRRFGLLNANCCGGVSLVQCHILHEIRRVKTSSIQQVANELCVDITTFSRQIKTLEKKRLITRRTSPDDLRVSLLELTEEGATLMTKIDQSMTLKIEKIFSTMTPFERETVARSIEMLNSALAKASLGVEVDSYVTCCK